jgi:N-acetylglutamate synthase-like GNAT family acetyltransferase
MASKLEWVAEKSARWDENKRRIVGEAPVGVFDRRYRELSEGEVLAGDWWRVEEDGEVVGYGWLDVVWGDAEVLLATAPGKENRGIGAFILKELEREAGSRGLNYLYNVVRPTHPDGKNVTDWLVKRGFKLSEDGSFLRAVVHRESGGSGR